MKAKYLFSICCCFIAALSYSQNKSSGYKNLDTYYAQHGISVETSDVFTLGEDTNYIDFTIYGGNHYDISIYSPNDEKYNIQTKLIDENGKICAKGTNRIEVDMRFTFGHFSYKLLVYAPKSEKGKELLYVQSYKSFNNSTNDHTKNKTHKGFNTLEGVEIIEQFKNNVVKEIENHLSKALAEQGYKVSEVKVLDAKEPNKVLPYVFYKGNKYYVYAMDALGAAEIFKVVEPERINPFVFDKKQVEREEKEIFRSKDGVVGMTLEEQSRNFSLGIRLAETTNSFGGLSVFVIGYKSKDNSTNDPSKNKSEKAYFN